MKRVLILTMLASTAQVAEAQVARRAIPAGEVTGLEALIEGPLEVTPGEIVRYAITVYEVVRDRDFRPASEVGVKAHASYSPSGPVAEVQTDGYGRALIAFEVPEDLEGSFQLQIVPRSERRLMRRRFAVRVRTRTTERVELIETRASAPVGARWWAVGRVLVDGRPKPEAEVELALRDERGVTQIDPVQVRTDARGVFVGALRLPDEAGSFQVLARSGEQAATRRVRTFVPEPVDLDVVARPRARVVESGSSVEVDVHVRDGAGRPLGGARVRGLRDAEGEPIEARTDARGVATLEWHPRPVAGIRDLTGELEVTVAGHGARSVPVRSRIAGAPLRLRAHAEGRLVPGVASRIFVLAQRPDGSPAANEEVRVEAPRIGSVSGRTDAAGVAMLEARLDPQDAPDACGGGSALAVRLSAGTFGRELCLDVDPDATLRVRAEVVEDRIQARVERAPTVADAPIALMLTREHLGRVIPVATAVLEPGEDSHVFAHPDAPGDLLVRGRPLFGGAQVALRGGSARVVPAREPLRASGSTSLAGETSRPAAGGRVLLPWEVARRVVGTPSETTENARRAEAARRTPVDRAAPMVLRDGSPVAVPAPEDPAALGVLRDAWRQRARYRSGRLALVVRALEGYVAEASLGRLEDVARRDGSRWRFNRAVLEAVEGGRLGAEGMRDLGGAPLTITALEALDPNLTFDRVARRITRERLLRVLVALREYVDEQGLDLAFGRRGDPSSWLNELIGRYVADRSVQERTLVDAWGRRLVLRRARPRFEALVPVPGWELVSAGPDGRVGNGDDVYDPLERVVPRGSFYAEAVGEDALLMRLGGVSLGRATVSELGNVFGVTPSYHSEEDETVVEAPLVPAPALADPGTLPVLSDPGTGARLDAEGELILPSRPGRWGVVAFASDGGPFVRAMRSVRSGGSLVFAGELPKRLAGELRVPLDVVALRDAPAVDLEVSGEGVEASLESGSLQALRAGESERVWLRLRAGARRGAVTLTAGSEGAVVGSRIAAVRRVDAEVARSRFAGAAVDDSWRVRLPLPDDVDEARAELVVVTPGALGRDPGLASLRRRAPAILAWAQVMSGAEPQVGLVDEARTHPVESMLERACLQVVSADEGPLPMPRRRGGEGTDPAEQAAALTALASVAAGLPIGDASRQNAQLREGLWAAAGEAPANHALGAKAAAALLLSDPRDQVGRAFFVRVRDALEDGLVPGENPRARVVATAALAIAAAQLGETELRDALTAALAPRAYLAMRDPESAFWLLAASVYGAFGVGETESVRWAGEEVALEDGVGRVRTRVSSRLDGTLEHAGSGTLLARITLRYPRAEEARDDAPVELTIEGSASGEIAALELVVKATAEVTPVVAVQLPPGARLDREARAAIAEVVRRIDAPDARGLVQMQLPTLAEEQELRIPLPIRWIGEGERRGLAVGAWDESRPWEVTSVPARAL